jgi:hypothetical protein
MENIITTLKAGLIVVGTGLASLFGYSPVSAPILSGTYQTPEVRALFTTTLASKITSTDTSMTLTSATDKDGTSLASSTYGFIIDEGTSVEEFVLADCTGTACTNMTRGLSVRTGTTTVSSLRFEHRRGASVKITDAPSLIFAVNFLKGRQNAENVLRYSSNVSTTTVASDNRNLVNYELLNYFALGSTTPAASETVQGYVELATGLEAASSSSVGGTGARTAIPSSIATSTYNSATAGLKVVVTQNNGKIDSGFISTSTLLAASMTSPTASSTFLSANASNNLTWNYVNQTIKLEASGINANLAGAASTTLLTIPVPENTVINRRGVRIKLYGFKLDANGGDSYFLAASYGGLGTTTLSIPTPGDPVNGVAIDASLEFVVFANNSSSSQILEMQLTGSTTPALSRSVSGSGAANGSVAQNILLVGRSTASGTMTGGAYSAEIIGY